MHILFLGYGKTSQRVAKQLFQQGHHITTVSLTAKDDPIGYHLQQDIHQLNLSMIELIQVVYVLLAPSRHSQLTSIESYKSTYVESIKPILNALKSHPVQRIIVVSSTRVYGEDHGEVINDDSPIKPKDEQGNLLLKMEQLWHHAYADKVVIVRPTGIYSSSSLRMQKLAETTKYYPNIHWSNRIHIEDLARFLAHLIHVEHPKKSYICSNNQPEPLHERILKLQQKLNLPELLLESRIESGKKIYAQNMFLDGFKLKH